MANEMKLNCEVKNFIIIGDSYSTFKGYIPVGYAPYYTGESGTDLKAVSETWWHRFADKTGKNLVLNDSWSGSTICYTGRVSPEYAYRSSFVNRMHDMIKEDFFNKNNIDTVFIFGGTNDSWLDTTPKGELMLDGWCEDDLYSTLPAIGYMISRLKEALPSGNVVFIINTDLNENISEAIKSASRHFGTSFIELHDIDKEVGHPTVKGMGEICDQVIEAIEG